MGLLGNRLGLHPGGHCNSVTHCLNALCGGWNAAQELLAYRILCSAILSLVLLLSLRQVSQLREALSDWKQWAVLGF